MLEHDFPIPRPGGLALTAIRYSLVPGAAPGFRQNGLPHRNGYELNTFPKDSAFTNNYGANIRKIQNTCKNVLPRPGILRQQAATFCLLSVDRLYMWEFLRKGVLDGHGDVGAEEVGTEVCPEHGVIDAVSGP